MRNQNKNLRREELRETGNTACSWKRGISSGCSKRKRPLPFLSHLVTFLPILRLKAGKDHCAHEKTWKKTIPQFPWPAEGDG